MKKRFTETHPYVSMLLLGIICTFMTGLGVSCAIRMNADEMFTYQIMTVTILISVGFGLLIMKKTKVSFQEYGFCGIKKASNRLVLWYLPLIVIEILPILFYGFEGEITFAQYPILLCFAIAVGIHEELYFRGLILTILKKKGIKKAVIVSSVFFGCLHLANALSGKSLLYVALQISFAFLVGIVLAEIVCITNSLWIVILWHASHDFISSISGDSMDVKALILLALQVVILLAYAWMLWKSATREENVL